MSINIIGHPQDKGGGVALFLSLGIVSGAFQVVPGCSGLFQLVMGYGSLFGLFQFLQTTTSHSFFPFKFTENDKDMDKDFYKVGQLYCVTKQGKCYYKMGELSYYKAG